MPTATRSTRWRPARRRRGRSTPRRPGVDGEDQPARSVRRDPPDPAGRDLDQAVGGGVEDQRLLRARRADERRCGHDPHGGRRRGRQDPRSPDPLRRRAGRGFALALRALGRAEIPADIEIDWTPIGSARPPRSLTPAIKMKQSGFPFPAIVRYTETTQSRSSASRSARCRDSRHRQARRDRHRRAEAVPRRRQGHLLRRGARSSRAWATRCPARSAFDRSAGSGAGLSSRPPGMRRAAVTAAGAPPGRDGRTPEGRRDARLRPRPPRPIRRPRPPTPTDPAPPVPPEPGRQRPRRAEACPRSGRKAHRRPRRRQGRCDGLDQLRQASLSEVGEGDRAARREAGPPPTAVSVTASSPPRFVRWRPPSRSTPISSLPLIRGMR